MVEQREACEKSREYNCSLPTAPLEQAGPTTFQLSMMIRTALNSSMLATLLKYQFLELEAQGSGFQGQARLHGDFLDRLGYRMKPCLKMQKCKFFF